VTSDKNPSGGGGGGGSVVVVVSLERYPGRAKL
jgi:hypothetical protein